MRTTSALWRTRAHFRANERTFENCSFGFFVLLIKCNLLTLTCPKYVANLFQLRIVGPITRVLLFYIVLVVDRALGMHVCVLIAFVVQRALAVI